jgi:uncharacterized DUF497 family protein
MTTRFTWDPTKAKSNEGKHGVCFDEATRVFSDPFALTEQDRIEDGEYRRITIGEAYGVILFVAHTYRDEDDEIEVIHIISARHAARSERRRYEEARFGRVRN